MAGGGVSPCLSPLKLLKRRVAGNGRHGTDPEKARHFNGRLKTKTKTIVLFVGDLLLMLFSTHSECLSPLK